MKQLASSHNWQTVDSQIRPVGIGSFIFVIRNPAKTSDMGF